MQTIKLWDIPTRLFHWLLVLSVIALFVSGKLGGNAIEWHGRIGVFTVGLLIFRLVWGFAGTTYARFSQFFPTPARIFLYLKGKWHGLGHNPLGALSVFALLLLVAIQAISGLFTTDDIAFHAPLYPLFEAEFASRLTNFHHQFSNVLLGFVILHVATIVFYALVKKDNLLKPMLTGKKEIKPDEPPAKDLQGGGVLPLILAFALAALAIWLALGSWIPVPPPPPVEEAPLFNF